MRLTRRCFAVTGLAYLPPWTVNAGFVVGDDSTLVIDTGATFAAARTIHGYAGIAAPENAIVVVNTERHLDHVSGNGFFASSQCTIYGHHAIRRSGDELARGIEEWNDCVRDPVRRDATEVRFAFGDTAIANPDRILTDGFRFDLGGISVDAVATPGHTPTNFVLFAADEGVLYAGDTIVSGYAPNMSEGGPEAWAEWIRALGVIETLQPEWVVPGHGDVLHGDAIAREIARIRGTLQRRIAAV